jgi:hypothetical protein
LNTGLLDSMYTQPGWSLTGAITSRRCSNVLHARHRDLAEKSRLVASRSAIVHARQHAHLTKPGILAHELQYSVTLQPTIQSRGDIMPYLITSATAQITYTTAKASHVPKRERCLSPFRDVLPFLGSTHAGARGRRLGCCWPYPAQNSPSPPPPTMPADQRPTRPHQLTFHPLQRPSTPWPFL